MPLCGCQQDFWFRRRVKRTVAQHGEQDVAAATCKCDEGLVMTFSLADFARVVCPGDRVSKSGKGGQEHRALQLFVATSGRQFTADGGSGAPRDRRKTCVSGQMRRGCKGAARHIDQESRGGPNPDSRHAGQDRMKRVRKDEPLDFFGHFVSLRAQSC